MRFKLFLHVRPDKHDRPDKHSRPDPPFLRFHKKHINSAEFNANAAISLSALPQLCCITAVFLYCRSFAVLPQLYYLYCRSFAVLRFAIYIAAVLLHCRSLYCCS